MSKIKIEKEFKPLMQQMQEQGAQISISETDEGDKSAKQVKESSLLNKKALADWAPDHTLSFVAHLDEKPTEKFLALLEQLAEAGVKVVPLASDDYDRSLTELKERSPISAKAIRDLSKEGGTKWPSWASWNRSS